MQNPLKSIKGVWGKGLLGKGLFCWACILASMMLVWLVMGQSTSSLAQVSGVPDLPKEWRPKEWRNQKSYVLVEFYTEWCGVCQEMAPYVENLKVEGCKDLHVLQVDTDQPKNQKYAVQFAVDSVPSFVLFNPEGKPVYVMDGVISNRVLRKNILKAMNRPPKGPISLACKF